jgi:hypothetical protein
VYKALGSICRYKVQLEEQLNWLSQRAEVQHEEQLNWVSQRLKDVKISTFRTEK